MCLGLAPHERLIRSAAAGPGNVLVLLGALTGRDGIGGASVLASAELGEGDEAKRPSVQIGDPFAEKKLLECCLELLDRELLVSLQDLGAAGLTSSASEMASKGGVGLDIDVSRVPLREPGMEPFEIMVSESQERMLCVVEPERVDEVIAVCERWETLATPIGAVTDAGALRVLDGGAVVGELPVGDPGRRLPALRPRARRAPTEPLYAAPPPASLAAEDGRPRRCWRCCARANIASRRPVFEQYDPVVQSRTVRRPEQADAAVLALPDGAAIAVSIDGNGRRVACDPRARRRRGGATSARPTSPASGAEPLGLTNCLNFGNPEKPHVAWQLTEAVEGLARGLRGARRSRSSAATSRSTTRRRAARSSPRRWSGWSAGCPTPRAPGGSASRARATRSRSSARSRRRWPARSWPSSGASRPRARCPRIDARRGPRRPRGGPRRGPIRRARTAPTTSPRAGSRWRWPSAASPAGSAPRCALPGGARAVRRGAGPGVRRLRPPRTRSAGLDAMIGRVGGDALEIAGPAERRSFRAARDARERRLGRSASEGRC